MAEWTNLPKDLLEQISKCFDTSIDILRFRSVCSSWRSSVSPKRRRLSGTFRILPNDGISCTSFGFYLTRRTIFLIGVPNSHNQTDPDGWLVKIEEGIPERKHLLNPLSRYRLNSLPNDFPRVFDLFNFRVFELGQEYVLHHVNYKSSSPSFSDAGNLYMEKVVMIWLNYENENDFVLLTIHVSGKLAMFKSGDRRWTIIQDMPSPYDDVIVYKGNFYAVDNTGRTVIVRLNTELGLIANPVFGGDKKYLVESLGDLLLVDMYLSIDTAEGGLSFGEEFLEHLAQYMSERTVRFKVFKLDKEAQTWIEVKSLGDRVLFLGDDSTFSASVSDLSGCKGNCIFFVDNFFYSRDENLRANGGDDGVLAGRDIGVFDLETGCIGPLGNYPEYAKMFWPPPHWLLQHH
ncbi:F-box protein SKIP23 isoform X1 [Ricinus communis]|uniref:F-box protein SKIP23 isoform X1 n=1 Tax=Ricinus communis TaxID=3988 RepID=UPI00201AD29D|nr:F-box protein SKIP23 isoform X1 [Ricinus communis]